MEKPTAKTCDACGKPTTSRLCSDCQTRYARALHTLARIQLPALTSIMLRQARIGEHQHTPNRGTAPLPIDINAAMLIQQAEQTLASIAGQLDPRYARLGWHHTWQAITINRRKAVNLPTAGDDLNQLTRITDIIETALTPEDDRIIIGDCPECGTQLTTAPAAETVTCPACHTTSQTHDIINTRNNRLNGITITGTPSHITQKLKHAYGITVKRNTLSQWIRRGTIHAQHAGLGTYTLDLGELCRHITHAD